MPISYVDLVTRVRDGALDEQEAASYFLPSSPLAATFAPTFILNEVEVDVSGIERVARASATELAYQASQGVRGSRLLSLGAATPDGTIIAEGDSWFNLPDIAGLVPPTLIDILSLTRPINNIAHWGDTLSEIVLSGEYVSHLSAGGVEYLLFSAGGNDALGGGSLATYIRQRVSGDNNPDNASLYVRPSYYRMAQGLEAVYHAFLTNVRRISPATVVAIHGYDYCLPRRDGLWLGEPLRFRGFDPHFQRDFARAIVRVLVDDFNTRLERLASSFNNVVYVDLRNTLDEDEWWDELHPDESGAEKLASRIAGEIGTPRANVRRTSAKGRTTTQKVTRSRRKSPGA